MLTLRRAIRGLTFFALVSLPPASPAMAQPLPEPLADGLVHLEPALAKTERTLSAGEQVKGTLDERDASLSSGAYVEAWTYQGQAGEDVTFDMGSVAFDAFVGLAHDTGAGPELIAYDDDGGDGYDARLAVTLPATGSYFVIATSAPPRQRGGYVLRATSRDTGGPTEQSVGALPRSGPVDGTFSGDEPRLNGGQPYDLWQFESPGGERVRFTTEGASAAVFVARPVGSGAVPVEGRAEHDGAVMEVDLLEPGPYLVVVAGRAPSSRGDYRLRARVAGQAAPPPAPASLRTASASPADPDERYALLVGIDDYPGSGNDLPSSVADVELMKRVLVDTYGFDEANVLLLLDEQATREHVIAAFEQHLGQAGLDGVAVFYYSGHGMRLDGNVGLTGAADPEEDGRDEALALWGWGGQASVLLDDELGTLMDRLSAERALAVLDACNSGTGSRGGLVKSVTPEALGEALRVPEPYEYVTAKVVTSPGDASPPGPSGLLDPARGEMRHLLLSAARAEEFALARRDPWPGGQIASAFTYFLAAGMEAAEETTFDDLMARVRPLTSQYAQGVGGRQTPQLEGPPADVPLHHYLARRPE